MSKVIPFTGITKLDMTPDVVLEAAKGRMEGVIILGYTENGDEYFASTYADGGTVMWLLERCKRDLLGACE